MVQHQKKEIKTRLQGRSSETLPVKQKLWRASPVVKRAFLVVVVSIAFELAVAKERCRKSKYMPCFDEHNEYKKKWMLELNILNMMNPKRPKAMRTCMKQSIYHIKSEGLKELASAIARAMGNMK